MNDMQKQALRYVKNTGGGATKEHFVEDHEPIGDLLWNEIFTQGWVTSNNDGKIILTHLGEEALK